MKGLEDNLANFRVKLNNALDIAKSLKMQLRLKFAHHG